MKKTFFLQHQNENIQNLNQYKILPNGFQIEDFKYKTELCKNYVKYGHCPYNDKCRFAHGKSELKLSLTLIETSNYKSKMCQSFFSQGFCNYGQRCLFRHDHRTLEQIKQEFQILRNLKMCDGKQKNSRFDFAKNSSQNLELFYKKCESQDLSGEMDNFDQSYESTAVDSNSETGSSNNNSNNFGQNNQIKYQGNNITKNIRNSSNQNINNNSDILNNKEQKGSKLVSQYRIQSQDFTYQDFMEYKTRGQTEDNCVQDEQNIFDQNSFQRTQLFCVQ